LGLKSKQIEPFAKQHLFNNSSVKKQNREQKQTNAPLWPRHWQCTEQFGQLCLASDFNCIPVLQWKHKLSLDLPISAKAIVYDEDERPELFAYFVQGGSGQVLVNAHGNVYFGVADGTACTMHLLAWNDP
jgi:hypothetical protein